MDSDKNNTRSALELLNDIIKIMNASIKANSENVRILNNRVSKLEDSDQ